MVKWTEFISIWPHVHLCNTFVNGVVRSQNKRRVSGAGTIVVVCRDIFKSIWFLNLISHNWQKPFAKLLHLSPLMNRTCRYSTFIFQSPRFDWEDLWVKLWPWTLVRAFSGSTNQKNALSLYDAAYSFTHLGDCDESCERFFFHPSSIVFPAARGSLVVNAEIHCIV